MKHRAILTSIALVALSLAALATTPSWAEGNELRLRADLRAPAEAGEISGIAEFRYISDLCYIQYNVPGMKGWTAFSVKIEGLEPGTAIDVIVAGTVVGKIDVNASGRGHLNMNLDSHAQGDELLSLRLSDNFPSVGAGTLIQVGRLTGTLEAL